MADVAAAYTGWGWQVDAAVLDALAAVETAEDVAAVKAAILPLYRPVAGKSRGCAASGRARQPDSRTTRRRRHPRPMRARVSCSAMHCASMPA